MPEVRAPARRTKLALVTAALALAGGASYSLVRSEAAPVAAPAPARPQARPAGSAPDQPRGAPEAKDDDDDAERPLKMPDGHPARVGCRDARRVITQVHARIAQPLGSPRAAAVSDALVGWLDPHGLWSAAPDAPTARAARRLAPALIEEVERSPRDASDCAAAREVGRLAQAWVSELRVIFDHAATRAPRLSRAQALALASESVFEDDPVTRPGRELARLLGERAGAFEKAFGEPGTAAFHAASERLLPTMSLDDWTAVVLAAAVRAYVPALDAHSQWAPLDEEWSLYAADAATDPGPRLWGEIMRTPVGVRIVSEPAPPLRAGDVVLGVGGIATAGLSVEQVEQLAQLEAVGAETARPVTVVRAGDARVERLSVTLPPESDEPPPLALASSRVPYAGGSVLVVSLPDVPDGLGEELSELVAASRDAPPLAILLDLRGNGGGSTDGAAGAIGVFLPGAPSFPYRHRGGAIEIQRALSPAPSGIWRGPVAALVDGYTASAAEMIAGALEAYDRGTVVGARTFGKGCIQEYFDDRPGVGVLRLTTMLYALPDGSPVQHVGVTPELPLPMPSTRDREATLPGTLASWRGPDIRDRAGIGGPAWPAHHGKVGPCEEPMLCAALRRLGAQAVASLGHPRPAARAPRSGSAAP
ncbi:MAG: S41 family peptidase [Sorangiineae bacterium]|nr:S41 family peptidase [Polyangiaceae bacterium]MEB2324375.1 S41 family peptidase [Sorangiineae bacterium]